MFAELDPNLNRSFFSILLVAFFCLTIFYVLPWLSEQISFIGIYHKCEDHKENRRKKKILKSYFLVSIPLMASYILILHSLQVSLNGYMVFIVVATTMGTLLVIRIRGNPTKDGIGFKRLFPADQHNEIIEQHRERILSFIFSLISAQVIIALLVFGHLACLNTQFNFKLSTGVALEFIMAYLIGLYIICWYGERYLKMNPPVNAIDHIEEN